MSYGEPFVKICRAENGWTVEVVLPSEESSEGGLYAPTEVKTAIFTSVPKLTSFLKDLLNAYPTDDSGKSEDDFETVFAEALKNVQ